VVEDFVIQGDDLDNKFNPVGYIHFNKLSLEDKSQAELDS
jgi:hypothetical protein